MSGKLKVIIVGGGIGGCSAALFLDKVGIRATMYESHSSTRSPNVGSALGFGSNGLTTLSLISKQLADDIYSRGHKSAYFELRDSDGSIIGKFPAGREKASKGRNYGSIMIKRWDIHEALSEELQRRGIPIVYEKKVKNVEETANGILVNFVDGTTDTADLVIGADGIHSVVRKSIFPDCNPVYTGIVGSGSFLPKSILYGSINQLQDSECQEIVFRVLQ